MIDIYYAPPSPPARLVSLYVAVQSSPPRWSRPMSNPNRLDLCYSGSHPSLSSWAHILSVPALSPTLTDDYPELLL